MGAYDQILSILLNSKTVPQLPTSANFEDVDILPFYKNSIGKMAGLPMAGLVKNPVISESYLGTVTTAGTTTTETEIIDFINSIGFTIGLGELKIINVNALIDGSVMFNSFFYKPNQVGTYGNGNTVIPYSSLFKFNVQLLNSFDDVVVKIDLGDIGTDTIEDSINDGNEIELLANIVYVFECIISGVSKKYLYTGSQPIFIGGGNNSVTSANFIDITENGGDVQWNEIKGPQSDILLSGFTNDLPSVELIDENDMASNSATKAPTQKSVKAYVDDNIGGGASPVLVTQAPITSNNTTFNGTQKGLFKIYSFQGASPQTVTLNESDYAVDDIINIQRGVQTLELIPASGTMFKGVQALNGKWLVNDTNSFVAAKKDTDGKLLIFGNLKKGWTGAVTTSFYTGVLREGESNKTITVDGANFLSNMLVSVSSGATLNSWAYISSTQITLNLTATGVEGNQISVTYDNGTVKVDSNIITIATPEKSIILQTTSTSASYSPNLINKAGSTLKWVVSGGTTGTYDANTPTIDLSGNSGTATITITSADNLAGLTLFNMNAKNLTTLNISQATDLTTLQCYNNQLSSLNVSTLVNLVNLLAYQNIGITSINISNCTLLQDCYLQFCSIVALDISANINLTTLGVFSNQLTSINISNNPLLTYLRVNINKLTVSQINNLILNLDAHGVTTGTRDLRYDAQSPAANPTATQNTTNDVLTAYNSLISKGWTIVGNAPA